MKSYGWGAHHEARHAVPVASICYLQPLRRLYNLYNLALHSSFILCSHCFPCIRNISKPFAHWRFDPEEFSRILKYARSLNEAAMLGVGCRCVVVRRAIYGDLQLQCHSATPPGATCSRPFGTDGRRWRPNTESQACTKTDPVPNRSFGEIALLRSMHESYEFIKTLVKNV